MLRRSVVTDGTATGQGKEAGGILKDRPISMSILININSLYFLMTFISQHRGYKQQNTNNYLNLERKSLKSKGTASLYIFLLVFEK